MDSLLTSVDITLGMQIAQGRCSIQSYLLDFVNREGTTGSISNKIFNLWAGKLQNKAEMIPIRPSMPTGAYQSRLETAS